MLFALLALSAAAASSDGPPEAACLAFGRRRLPVPVSHFDEPNLDPWPGLTISGGTATWARLTRTLELGRLPPPGSVRPEELVQSLPVEAAPPSAGHELAVRVEVAHSPWSDDAAVVRVALTARPPDPQTRPTAHVVLVVDEVAQDAAALAVAREGLSQLVAGLRDDDTVAVVASGGTGRVVLSPTPWAESVRVLEAIDRLRVAEDGVLPGAVARAYQLLEEAPTDELRRVVLVSDGDLDLLERGDDLAAAVAGRAADGVRLAGLGYGEKHARDDSVEALVHAAGGPILHLAYPFDGRELADHLGGLLDPAALDVRVLVEWDERRVAAVHRVGNHLDRLTGLGPRDRSVGGELGAGQTATVLYEVKLHDRARRGSLGRVTVRSTPPGRGARERSRRIAEAPAPFAEASPDLRLAVAAASLGELLAGEQSVERVVPERVAALAAEAARREHPRDAQLVWLAERSAELIALREACRAR